MKRSEPVGFHMPASGCPPCMPRSIEPGSGERRPASFRAISVCISSSKRWKKEPVTMAETWPWSSLRVFTLCRSLGFSVFGNEIFADGGTTPKNSGLVTSPAMKDTLYDLDSGVVLNSSLPSGQKAVQGIVRHIMKQA